MSVCPACFADLKYDADFCPSCGARLEPPELQATHIGSAGAEIPARSSQQRPRTHASRGDDDARFLPGTLLGNRYRIIAQVGRGGMGEVYRADDLKLGQPVALKFLPEELTDDSEQLERLHKEVRLARQVSHPNVCRVYDIGEVGGQHFMSMEYIDGEDLQSLLRRIGRLSKDKGLQIARQLCAGLASAHERGVVHRDLKPRNVMVDGRGQARITDFGLADAAGERPREADWGGTLRYMAPEQLERGETSIQSDLYSLGLTLYELFTGKGVFEARSLTELRKQHAEPAFPAPGQLVNDLDPRIERAILHCLQGDAKDRPDSAMAVLAALPGGDSLEAAMLAGETPSPEMVAAAGESGRLHPAAGLSALAFMLIALLTTTLLAPRLGALPTEGLSEKPAVLEARAIALLHEFAGVDPDDASTDHACGFRYDEDVIGRAKEQNRSGPVLEFWYRRSPRALTPDEATYAMGHVPRVVSLANPVPTLPGMASVRLGPEGSLRELLAIPTIPAATASDVHPDWAKVFDQAGLDFDQFIVSQPNLTPPVYADRVWAWTARKDAEPSYSDRQVEAASIGEDLVYFQVIAPWTTRQWTMTRQLQPSFGKIPQQSKTSGERSEIQFVGIVALLVGSLVARRNWRLGRCDHRGAWYVALLMFQLDVLISLLQMHHHASAAHESVQIVSAISRAVFRGFRIWIYYLALEPYVRRIWPRSLTTWSRLLAGRFRDPLVERDVLLGAGVIFPAIVLLETGSLAFERAFMVNPDVLLGARGIIAALLEGLLAGVNVGLYFLLLILLFRLWLGNRWLAALAAAALLTGVTAAGSPSLVSWFLWGLRVTTVVFLLTQLGLLATVVALSSLFVWLAFPLPTDLTAWYATPGLSAFATVMAFAGYGFYTSLDQRAAFRDPLSTKPDCREKLQDPAT